MAGWQELSGALSPHKAGKTTLDNFWSSIRDEGSSGIKTDLQEDEYLCAIGYIKRRFSRCFHHVEVAIKDSGQKYLWTAHGWEVPDGVPSVAFLAAAPWLSKAIKAIEHVDSKLVWNFHDSAKALSKEYGEWSSAIRCVDDALHATQGSSKCWKALDGSVFFKSALDNRRLWDEVLWEKDKGTTLAALSALEKAVDLEPVSPFYAVLLMDGDSLGKQMSDEGKRDGITHALQQFTDGVPGIVQQHSGFLIYAGGDDVLAILPLEFALDCALALRTFYNDCFKSYPDIATSLSGAVIYAHIKTPLGRVLGDAHTVLDDVAKAHHGRDSIAVRVLKPGGEHLEWGMPWALAVNDASGKLKIDELVDNFRKQETTFASKFFYRIRQQFELLKPRGNTKDQPAPIPDNIAIDLLASEYINSGATASESKTTLTLDEARNTIGKLIDQCRPATRVIDPETERPLPENQWPRTPLPQPDAALLVRFLACKGVER